jgi:GAF domain-containing protein
VIGVPGALVSLVTDDRQVFVGAHGLPEPWASRRQTGLSHSFCRLVIEDNAPLVTDDARRNPRTAENLAIDDIGVIAYARTPLHDPEGQVLGSVCAIDDQPHPGATASWICWSSSTTSSPRSSQTGPGSPAAHANS